MAETFYGHVPCGYELVIDHIDTNPLNNNLDNLRIVPQRVNSNHKHIKSSSKYTGVCWDKMYNKWKSAIYINGKNIHLGVFDNELEASEYYENALKNHLLGLPIEVKRKNHSSKHKGVSWNKNLNKWNVSITINGIKKFLGYFNAEIEAYLYYENALKNSLLGLPIEVKKPNWSSKYKGVSWNKASKKWETSITINRKIKYLGKFKTELEAHNAYQNEINKLNKKI